MNINSKAKFVSLYRQGRFGNASPTWDSIDEWWGDKAKRPYARWHFRNRIPGGPTYYDLTMQTAMKAYRLICNQGTLGNFYVSEMAPTHKTILNGEVQARDGVNGFEGSWSLMYSPIKATMRESLSILTRHANGLHARMILQSRMDPYSFDWLLGLLEDYPNHIVEFSVYSCDWGTVPGRNTVFWEVRNY